jgi:hypothetical protein
MPTPENPKLYKKAKDIVYKQYPNHSAYRSGALVKKYKELGGTYIEDEKDRTLSRWFKEQWKNQRGEIGYKKSGDVYRPTIRVSKKTPVTFRELSPKQIKKAQKEKEKFGRVKRFNA